MLAQIGDRHAAPLGWRSPAFAHWREDPVAWAPARVWRAVLAEAAALVPPATLTPADIYMAICSSAPSEVAYAEIAACRLSACRLAHELRRTGQELNGEQPEAFCENPEQDKVRVWQESGHY